MNCKRYFIASIVLFVFTFLWEFVFHAIIMADQYDAKLSLLRPEAESGSMMWMMMLGFLILSFGVSYIFTKGYEGKGIGEGIRFGLIIAVTFVISFNLVNYVVFPWPGDWVCAWSVAALFQWAIGGIILAMIYEPNAA